MRLQDFLALIDRHAKKNNLDAEQLYFSFYTAFEFHGTLSYIPKGAHATYEDPIEAFAKEQDWQQNEVIEYKVYAADKVGNKFVIYIGTVDDFDKECDFTTGIEFDGALKSSTRHAERGTYDMYGFDEIKEALGLTGREEVILNYAGKDYPLDIVDNKTTVTKKKYNMYDLIEFFVKIEPSEAYQEYKAEEIENSIDPEPDDDPLGGDGWDD